MWRSRTIDHRAGRASWVSLSAALLLVLAWLSWSSTIPTALGQASSPMPTPVTTTSASSVTGTLPTGPSVLVGSPDPTTGQVSGAPLGQGTGPINPFGSTQPGASTNPQNESSTNPDVVLPAGPFLP